MFTKKLTLFLLLVFALVSCGTKDIKDNGEIINIDFSKVSINDSFWAPRLAKLATNTLPVCIDQIENQTGRMQNFINVAKGEGKHSGIFFDDSDVYKALEGIAYTLINNPDTTLETLADRWIDNFAAAQLPNGYINTYFTLAEPDKKWTDMDKHEMYCMGHMIEAAIAYNTATGKDKFLNVAKNAADHIMDTFGPDKRDWVPGHEEIELALVKLADTTGEKKYLDFAHWLLEERGHGIGTYDVNNPDRKWNPGHCQDEVPVSELRTIGGHAVRFCYLLCGMADVASRIPDTGYEAAIDTLWDDTVLRNMYVTGGIGSSGHNEGFTEDYDLPNKEAYCETCASIALILWNQRMNHMKTDARYIDVMERSMYNAALAGVGLNGDLFFYVNPLESDGNHHRQRWYGCACCPSNVARFLPSIGNYIYGYDNNNLYVNLFIGNSTDADIDGVDTKINMTTEYPFDGKVTINIDPEESLGRDLKVRIPDWCSDYTITIDGKEVKAKTKKGYVNLGKVDRTEQVVLDMEMPVTLVAADPRVKQDVGKRAVQRGPLVYCIEEIDNVDSYDNASVSELTTFEFGQGNGKLTGITTITTSDGNTLIPYYAWDTREPGKMKVWLDLK